MNHDFFDTLPSPDETGSAEYREIWHLLMVCAGEVGQAIAICEQFEEWGSRLAADLRTWQEAQ